MIAETSMETIEALLLKLKLTLARAGIPVKQLRIRRGNHKTKACSRAFNWLHDLSMSSEYQQFEKTRALCPDEIWERYDLFEIEGLQEQTLLEQASQKLRARWRKNRPAMFNSDSKKR